MPSINRASLSFTFVACLCVAACGDSGGGNESEDAGVRDTGLADTGPTTDTRGHLDGADLDAADGDPSFDDGSDIAADPRDAAPDSADTGEVCGWAKAPAAGAERTVLVGHPFSEEVGVPGTEIHLLRLGPDREITDTFEYLDIGFRPSRIELAPSGQLAFVLGERGDLASVRIGEDLSVVDEVALGGASYGDTVLDSGAGLLFVVGSNSTAEGGVSSVRVNCDGTMEVVDESFFSIRLADSLAPIGGGLAILLGGQAVFEPTDPNDIRLLRRAGDGWEEVDAFDVYADIVVSGRIAASPAGDRVLVPNSSPFSEDGYQVAVLSVDGTDVSELHRLTDMPDASEALFSPDGRTALVSLVEPGRIVVLKRDAGGRFDEVTRIAGIGLPDQMALVENGDAAGTVLVPSVDPSGLSNIAVLTFDGPGVVTDRGQYDLGNGFRAIPDAIAVTP